MRGRPLLVLGLAGLAVGVMAFLAPYISWYHGPVDVPLLATQVIAGWAFLFLGLYAWRRLPDNRTGPLMTAVGFAWFAADLSWIPTGLTWTTGFFLRDLYLPILGHLFLAFPSGRLEHSIDRRLVAVTYGYWAVSGLALMLFLDPRAEGVPFRNILAIHPDNEIASAVGQFESAISALLGLVFLAVLVDHWRRATPAARRALSPVAWAAVPTVLFVQVHFVAAALEQQQVFEASEGYLGALTRIALPLGFLIGLLRSRLGRSSVGDLVVELGGARAPQGGLREALARRLGDPSLQIGYFLPELGGYLDQSGRPVALPHEGSGRSVTLLEREGEPIAALIHDEALRHDPQMVEAVAAAARLAITNERLQAEVRAQLEEVRASRVRIVEAGDAERRRVERNLHDGAQQRLVSLSLSLAMLRETLEPDADPTVLASVDATITEAKQAIGELRELARGIHPVILTEEGLSAAVESLAERSPVPVSLRLGTVVRLPEPVEVTAYYVVAEALTNVAKYAMASRVEVEVAQADGQLVVKIQDDGTGGATLDGGTGLRGLLDRVAALAGTMSVESPPGGGTIVRARIPCDGS
ncbi:MAG: sensor histidine kinase [Actinomycetota bacterium]